MDSIIIRAGKENDAEFLAQTVMNALGETLCNNLAGGRENLPKVKALFTHLARIPSSQYSYKNSFVAEEEDTPVGAIIAYDGARLHELRKAFVVGANRYLRWNVSIEEADEWDDEATPDEIYLDSLFVVPAYRNQGIATRLITRVREHYGESHKPLGLLAEPENKDAISLYQHLGFRKIDISHFFRTPMIHMQRHCQTI